MQVTGEPWNDVTIPSLRFTRSCRKKKITLKIHKKSRFQPNEKMFAESCSVRYKDLLRAKKIFGVIGTLIGFVSTYSMVRNSYTLVGDMPRVNIDMLSNPLF